MQTKHPEHSQFLLILVPSLVVAGSLAILYFVILPAVPAVNTSYFPQSVATYATYRAAIYGHILFGTIALALGAINLRNALRGQHFKIHKWIGRIYVLAVAASAPCAAFMSFHAYAGTFPGGRYVATSGFLALALSWFITLCIALYQIVVRRDIRAHMMWMIINFSLTFAAVTLRLELIPLTVAQIVYSPDIFNFFYPLLAWACWLPNIIIGTVLARRKFRSSREPVYDKSAGKLKFS